MIKDVFTLKIGSEELCSENLDDLLEVLRILEDKKVYHVKHLWENINNPKGKESDYQTIYYNTDLNVSITLKKNIMHSCIEDARIAMDLLKDIRHKQFNETKGGNTP